MFKFESSKIYNFSDTDKLFYFFLKYKHKTLKINIINHTFHNFQSLFMPIIAIPTED